MSPLPLQFFIPCSSHPKTLKPLRSCHQPPQMKDALPSSRGAGLYVPPHHRLRSIIVASAATSATTTTTNDSKPCTGENSQNLSSFANSGANNSNKNYKNNMYNYNYNPYPYLPPHQYQQQQVDKKQPQLDQASGGGSNGEIELWEHTNFCTWDNADAWKWKLTTLLRSSDKQEIVSREKKDRRDYEQIAALASRMGLYSHLYQKIVVVSKDPLPNYRFDLDDKRPQRELILSPGLEKRVGAYLQEYISQKPKSKDAFSRSSSNGSIATDEGLFEQPEPLPHSKAAIEKILWRKSQQMHFEQQNWQVQPLLQI